MVFATISDPTPQRLLEDVIAGDREKWQDLLACHHDRLMRMVSLRLDARLRRRLDPTDVLQDVYLEAARHFDDYAARRHIPFFLWLRGIAANKLMELHRRHLGVEMRAVGREVSLWRRGPEATSAALAAQIVGDGTRPSEAAMRAEMRARLEEALNQLEPIDREAIALRHFEHLSIAEAAQVLGIAEKAAGKRYLRALKRLKTLFASMPGGEDLWP